ncbi:MAG: SEC-C metal-binding domain-containing protein [Desulfuromonadales bacterium]|nr:SEC-C metal-binding domain-containing protein [Desulfuromonadales bacterium]
MSNIGRNEPCPCGSGKKYKKCCLLKKDEFASRQRDKNSSISRALDWLSTRYPEAVAEAVHDDFFGDPNEEEMQAINELPPHLQEMLQVNIGEWMLADAHLEIDGERKPVHELLLGPGGPLLSAAGRDWLRRLSENMLGLYEVRESRPDEGLRLHDLLRPKQPDTWVAERSASQSLVRGDIFGARLVAQDDGWVLSGAVYPFSRDDGLACRDEILYEMTGTDWASEIAREVIGGQIGLHWLDTLITPLPLPELVDASSGEPILGTTDRYLVSDRAALAALLAEQPDVDGESDEEWVRIAELGDGRSRIQASLTLTKKDILEVFCRTRKLADESRAWLERIAGQTLRHQSRELVDPRSPKALEAAAPTAPPDIPPEVMATIVHDYLRQHYANWVDEKIPALGNKTPRQAIRSAKGRQAVIELLESYEHLEARRARDQGGQPFDFGFLWEQLDLQRNL